MKPYRLEKTIWIDKDFSSMGWHDATVWAISPNPDEYELLLDIDYIFQWVEPAEGNLYFQFWVSPVTMVFESAHSLKIGIESPGGSIEIADLYREHPSLAPNGKFAEHTYRFVCQEGEIRVRATGFQMFVRRSPVLLQTQGLSLKQRGGVSFEKAIMSHSEALRQKPH